MEWGQHQFSEYFFVRLSFHLFKILQVKGKVKLTLKKWGKW